MNDSAKPIYHMKDHQFAAFAEMDGIKPIEVKREGDNKITFVYRKDEAFDDLLRKYFSRDTVVPLQAFVQTVRKIRKELFKLRNGAV